MSEPDPENRSVDASERPFHAVVEAETIQTTLALADALVDEARVSLGADELRIPAIDPATVASVDLALGRAAFESYRADGGRVGVDLGRFRDIAAMADPGQSVELSLDPATRKLDVGIGELEYALGLLDPETVRSPPDRSSFDLGFAGEVRLAAETLGRAVRAADMVSDHVALGIDAAEEAFYVEAEGDTDDVSLALPATDLAGLSGGEAHSLFSVDYLKAVDGVTPDDRDLDLRLGTDVPLALSYEFADGAGSVEYLICPRIAAT